MRKRTFWVCVIALFVAATWELREPRSIPVTVVQAESTGPLRYDSIQVALVFGRAQGCEEASIDLVTTVAETARKIGVAPRLLAATIAVESACDRWSVSRAGAISYMQIMPRVWGKEYDFTGKYNLFNEHDNIEVGAEILAKLVKQYGVKQGLEHYQGVGTGRDGAYVAKILKLAGK